MFYFSASAAVFSQALAYVLRYVFCQALPYVLRYVLCQAFSKGTFPPQHKAPSISAQGLWSNGWLRTRARTQSRRRSGRTGSRSRGTFPTGLVHLGESGSHTSGTSPKRTLWLVLVFRCRSHCRTRQTVLVSSWSCRRCVGLRHLPKFRHRLQKSCSFYFTPMPSARSIFAMSSSILLRWAMMIGNRASRVPQAEQTSVLLSVREIAPMYAPGVSLFGICPSQVGQGYCLTCSLFMFSFIVLLNTTSFVLSSPF